MSVCVWVCENMEESRKQSPTGSSDGYSLCPWYMHMYICTYVRNVCMYVCMCVCKYVCMYAYVVLENPRPRRGFKLVSPIFIHERCKSSRRNGV